MRMSNISVGQSMKRKKDNWENEDMKFKWVGWRNPEFQKLEEIHRIIIFSV